MSVIEVPRITPVDLPSEGFLVSPIELKPGNKVPRWVANRLSALYYRGENGRSERALWLVSVKSRKSVPGNVSGKVVRCKNVWNDLYLFLRIPGSTSVGGVNAALDAWVGAWSGFGNEKDGEKLLRAAFGF